MKRSIAVLLTFAVVSTSQSVMTVLAAETGAEDMLLKGGVIEEGNDEDTIPEVTVIEDGGEEEDLMLQVVPGDESEEDMILQEALPADGSDPEELTALTGDIEADGTVSEDTDAIGEVFSEEGFYTEEMSGVPSSYETDNRLSIQAIGRYFNWDGVTNAAQFKGPDGKLYFAVDSNTNVTIFKTNDKLKISGKITIKKKHPTFGTAICDSSGNFYIVTGEKNTTDNKNTETVFISKYDSSGKHIATTGDNGSNNTMTPFYGGNCDAAIYNNILTVNYARLMYSGHQSNSVFSVDITNMSKVSVGGFYESHSFAQRVLPTDKGFVYVSEGDCYDRSFTIYSVGLSGKNTTYTGEYNIFDFWVQDGALDDYNMSVLNENFAHMGGLAGLSGGNVAFAASSAKSMNSNAAKEREEIFIQIFDPYKDLSLASSYVTSGERTGKGGPNGRDSKTNHGVKWLTSYGKDYNVENVQIASADRGEIVVLYELWQNSNYKGVYYITLSESGKVIKSATRLSSRAMLNPCEMPVSYGGKVFWVGNKYEDGQDTVYIYSLDTKLTGVTVSKKATGKSGLKYTGSTYTLVNDGKVTGGWFEYALGKDDTSEPSADKYSKKLPTAADAGKHYVWCKPVGDDSHYDDDSYCVTVRISADAASVKKPPRARKLAYNGKAQKLVSAGTANGGTMVYSTSFSGPFKKDIPKAKAKGTYYIFYKVDGDRQHEDSGVYGPVKVVIGNRIKVKGVKLNKTSASVVKGKKITLKATISPSNASNKAVTWKSSNSSIASVSDSGVVKGKKTGTAKITVTTKDGKKTAVCKVTVKKAVKVSKVTLNKTKVTLKKGDTLTLKASIRPSNATTKAVTWKSDDKKIATVNKNGKVKGISKGTVKITVTTKDGNKKASCRVTVK